MTLKTPTKPLLDALELASIAIPSRTTLPVLTCAKFDVSQDSVTVTCDSLDARVSVYVPGIESDSEFSFLASPRMFKAALRGDDAEISFDKVKRKLNIKSGGVTNLSTVNVDEFPPEWKTPKTNPVNATDLLRAIRITATCASDDAGRPGLCGIMWNPAHKEMAATDGRMLTLLPLELDLVEPATIPTAHSKIIAACFLDVDEIQVGQDEGKLFLQAGGIRVWARLFEGNQVNYRAVIPQDYKPVASFSREDLQTALASLDAFVAGDEFQKVKITTGEEWQAKAGNGDNETSVPIRDVEPLGRAVESFAVNRGNVLKLLRYWTADRVTLSMNDAVIVLKPEDDSGCMGLTMQFRS